MNKRAVRWPTGNKVSATVGVVLHADYGTRLAARMGKLLAEMGDAFPELLCTLALVLKNGFGRESARAPDSPRWLTHGWAILAKANGAGRRPAHSN